MSDPGLPRWQSPGGDVIACAEKLKVLRQNIDEIRAACQDALDDAVLMGCDEGQFRAALVAIVASLQAAFPPREP